MPEHTGEGECLEAAVNGPAPTEVHRDEVALAESPRFHPPGLVFKNALEAHEWHEIDGQGADWEHAGELKCRDEPATWDEWQRWQAATERLGCLPWERIVNPDQRRRLRYQLKCSIGVVPGAEHATADGGYTDDLDVANWWAERSSYPGWDVYDHETGEFAGGGEPMRETWLRLRIEAWIAELTRPGWSLYPYLHGDAVSRAHRERADREALERYPGWRPAPEQVLAPLRVALYAAMAAERAAYEADPPGRLAIYPDGRDLEPGYVSDFEVCDRRVV